MFLACSDAKPATSGGAQSSLPTNRTDTAVSGYASAQTWTQRVLTEHIRQDSGFSARTLAKRKEWFTPTLYELMRRDMQSSAGEIGVIEADA